jgi:hypothetical protein
LDNTLRCGASRRLGDERTLGVESRHVVLRGRRWNFIVYDAWRLRRHYNVGILRMLCFRAGHDDGLSVRWGKVRSNFKRRGRKFGLGSHDREGELGSHGIDQSSRIIASVDDGKVSHCGVLVNALQDRGLRKSPQREFRVFYGSCGPLGQLVGDADDVIAGKVGLLCSEGGNRLLHSTRRGRGRVHLSFSKTGNTVE